MGENEYTEEKWEGFRLHRFSFEGKEALLVMPDEPANGKWMLKTEYFGAFPGVELELLKKGYHLAYVANQTRWCLDEDLDRKARFVRYLSHQYPLSPSCVIVGMSCGGMIGVKFAAKYPDLVSSMYLDAPVMNLLSCPAGIGMAEDSMWEEFEEATQITLSQLINYREHPVDKMGALLKADIPIVLVCGDSDTVVPFEENGKILYEFYRKNGGRIELILKEGCGHHPHGLEQPGRIVELLEGFEEVDGGEV